MTVGLILWEILDWIANFLISGKFVHIGCVYQVDGSGAARRFNPVGDLTSQHPKFDKHHLKEHDVKVRSALATNIELRAGQLNCKFLSQWVSITECGIPFKNALCCSNTEMP